MIKLDITTFVFLYILFSVVVIMVIWALFGYKYHKGSSPKDIDYIWKCAVCFNNYIDSRHEDISICPLCGSYNKRQSSKAA